VARQFQVVERTPDTGCGTPFRPVPAEFNHCKLHGSGGATSGRSGTNDLAEELPPWLAPWLTKISMNFINIAHKEINLCATACK